MPSSKSADALAPAWLRRIAIAHRGLHDSAAGIPENSLAAVLAAADAGYGAEIDVQLSGDGAVMVFHDDDLERLLGRRGRVSDTQASILTALPLLGTVEKVPRLEDLLARLAGATPLLIEIKAPFERPFTALLKAVLAQLASYAGPVALQSFHPGVITWLETHAPMIPRGQIATAPEAYSDRTPEQAQALMRELATNPGTPGFLAYDIAHLPSDLTRAARAAGRPVLGWTVRTAEQRALARVEADNIIFEHCRP